MGDRIHNMSVFGVPDMRQAPQKNAVFVPFREKHHHHHHHHPHHHHHIIIIIIMIIKWTFRY